MMLISTIMRRQCWGVGGSALAGNDGASVVAHWQGNGVLSSHSVGTGTLVSEEERPDNQHEVERVEGRRRGKHYKG
jgi:hypothetical protein